MKTVLHQISDAGEAVRTVSLESLALLSHPSTHIWGTAFRLFYDAENETVTGLSAAALG
jgi:hypothetical protein